MKAFFCLARCLRLKCSTSATEFLASGFVDRQHWLLSFGNKAVFSCTWISLNPFTVAGFGRDSGLFLIILPTVHTHRCLGYRVDDCRKLCDFFCSFLIGTYESGLYFFSMARSQADNLNSMCKILDKCGLDSVSLFRNMKSTWEENKEFITAPINEWMKWDVMLCTKRSLDRWAEIINSCSRCH